MLKPAGMSSVKARAKLRATMRRSVVQCYDAATKTGCSIRAERTAGNALPLDALKRFVLVISAAITNLAAGVSGRAGAHHRPAR